MIDTKKAYIGDGAYVELGPCGIVLTTEDGINITNRIVLEPEVLDALLKWIKNLSGCATCGKPQEDSIHVRHGNDVDAIPVKHFFVQGKI